MPTINDVQTWSGRDAVDNDGDKVGAIKDIYLDRQSGEPEWAAVKTGLFGTKVSFVPLEGASAAGDEVRLAYDKATIKDAPNVEADGELSPRRSAAVRPLRAGVRQRRRRRPQRRPARRSAATRPGPRPMTR